MSEPIELTKAQRDALEWLNKRNGTGVFTKASRYQTVIAAGEVGPFMRATWNALAKMELVTISDKRITSSGKLA